MLRSRLFQMLKYYRARSAFQKARALPEEKIARFFEIQFGQTVEKQVTDYD